MKIKMKVLRSGLAALLLVISSFSLAEEKLFGEWVSAGNLECPDFLELYDDGRYEVFNDCFALDREAGLVQKGTYSLSEGRKIRFSADFTVEGYDFLEEIGGNRARIDVLTRSELKICVSANSSAQCNTQLFRKREE